MLLEKTDTRINNRVDKATELFNFAKDAVERFKNDSPEVRREMLAYIGSNPHLFNQKLILDLEKPLLYMEGASLEVKAIHARFEPLNNGINKELLWHAYAENETLSARLDSNQRPSP